MSLLTGYNVEVPAHGVNVNNWQYVTNDFDRVQVWDGVAASTTAAGMSAPATAPTSSSTTTGTITAGVHLIRYRYLNSKSPGALYRSNPSPNLSYTAVASTNQKITLGLVASSDARADKIIVEMTQAAGTVFYEVATITSATSYAIDISDALLGQNNLASTYDDFGHEQPPLGSFMVESRGFAFLGGSTTRSRTVSVTNGSPTINWVSGPTFSTNWAGRMVQIGSDGVQYVVSSATTTVITVATNYAGSTSASTTATITSNTPNRIFWSKQYFPESWKAATRAMDTLNGRGDVIRGMADFVGDVWILGSHTVQRLVFATDPGADGELDTVPGEFGIWNQRCLVGVDGVLFGWGPNGAWMATGRTKWISRPIDQTAIADLDASRFIQFHGAYDPDTKVVRWWYVINGESTPRGSIALELPGSRWCQHPYRQAIAASCVAVDSNGKLRMLASDSVNSRTWYAYGATDGVPATSSGSYTGNSGSTTTVVQVNEALPTAGNGLVGAMLYRPSTGEERAITANTASAVTVAALATAPAAGEKLYVGAIPWSITTGWWTGPGMQDKKRPAHLHIKLVPSATGTLKVQLYVDFASTPYVWTNPDAQQYPEGVSIIDGQNYITVALNCGQSDGFVPIPMPEDWSRSLRAVVTCDDPAGTLQIIDLRFHQEDPDEEGEEDRE